LLRVFHTIASYEEEPDSPTKASNTISHQMTFSEFRIGPDWPETLQDRSGSFRFVYGVLTPLQGDAKPSFIETILQRADVLGRPLNPSPSLLYSKILHAGIIYRLFLY